MPTRMLYAQSLAQGQYTNTGNWDDIAGLSLTLPAESADEKFALVILNVPNPYAKGNNYPGCNFTIRLNGQIDNNVPIACFTSYNKVADPATAISSGRVPTTLVARIQLATGKKTVIQGAWQSIRGATAVVDTPSTISAVLGRS